MLFSLFTPVQGFVLSNPSLFRRFVIRLTVTVWPLGTCFQFCLATFLLQPALTAGVGGWPAPTRNAVTLVFGSPCLRVLSRRFTSAPCWWSEVRALFTCLSRSFSICSPQRLKRSLPRPTDSRTTGLSPLGGTLVWLDPSLFSDVWIRAQRSFWSARCFYRRILFSSFSVTRSYLV